MLVLEVKKEGSDAAACRLADLAVERVHQHEHVVACGVVAHELVHGRSSGSGACAYQRLVKEVTLQPLTWS